MCDKRHLNDDNSDRDNNDDANDNNNDDANDNNNDNDDDVGASVDQAQAAVLGLQVPSLAPAQCRPLPPLHHFHLDANVAKALSRENAFKRF